MQEIFIDIFFILFSQKRKNLPGRSLPGQIQRSCVHFAFQLDAGVVDAGNVFDNSQPQTGAAGGLAPALIHPVEAFEHAGLRVFRDTDAVILDGQGTMAVPGAGGDELDLAAGSIVAGTHFVVAQVLAPDPTDPVPAFALSPR